ncbi:hypothetical protein BFP72_01935 [Reichenbachiella sp. 5M10]|uniref:hypothetical protein n=1 Tax=Reichenbachiella sp. 5M10 TaxID=1889772 RepID=UPI000C15DE12|nr:hypothetical protein [Reichenbachiella sp. 5M10]PIB34276.1 hypothetical protein BFP72_01935 [Reichenbachiella sp. 5M10]
MIKNMIYICLVLTSIHPLVGQELSPKKVPYLNAHVVNTLETMRSPFIRTNLDFNMGLATSSSFTTESVQLGDSALLNLNNSLVYVGLSMNYSQRIKDWAGFFFRVDYSARIGAGVQSILTQGINTIVTTETGVKFKVSSSDRHRLSMYYSLTNTQASLVDVSSYINDIINDKPNPSVTQKTTSLLSGGGLSFSYALSHWLAFNSDAKMAYGETLDRGQSKWQYFVGGNTDFYFGELIQIPVSLVLGGTVNTQVNTFSTQGDITANAYVKLAYAGSDAFFVSLSTYYGRTPIEKDNRHVGVVGFLFSTSLFF